MKIIGISGSLRQGSHNTALLDAVARICPENIKFEICNIGNIPLYNEDLDGDKKPASVRNFIESISSADAVLFSTPEYNYSISGVLKNAIDWASRPAFQSSFRMKPCGILTVSKSPVGGARAQADMKVILSSMLSPVFPAIEFLLPNAHEMFNESGNLTDEQAKRRLERYISGFIEWIEMQDCD